MDKDLMKKQRLSKFVMIMFAIFAMIALLIVVSVLNFLLWIAPFVIVAGCIYTIYRIIIKGKHT